MSPLAVAAGAGTMLAGGERLRCGVGRNGAVAAADKREGDGRTPIGSWPIRGALLRPDRVTADTGWRLPWRWLRTDDGWSDDPADPCYNRPVRLPHPFGAEPLWRDDHSYDVIVVLGHNDRPPVRGNGSAIFLHILPDAGVTAGCVALGRDALLTLLPRLLPDIMLKVVE